jgi:hypothetical protein
MIMFRLMRSEHLMICDDDVRPAPGDLQRFWDKRAAYGSRSAICARGHTFLPHALDMDQPDRAWREERAILFHDESVEDREIHFLHADNCLVARELLKEAAQVDLPRPEYVLVDDYWLSYVISHLCKGANWKIRASDVLTFHPTADDARIAMSQNSLVREQRVNFYLYHMQHGWPFPAAEDA